MSDLFLSRSSSENVNITLHRLLFATPPLVLRLQTSHGPKTIPTDMKGGPGVILSSETCAIICVSKARQSFLKVTELCNMVKNMHLAPRIQYPAVRSTTSVNDPVMLHHKDGSIEQRYDVSWEGSLDLFPFKVSFLKHIKLLIALEKFSC